MGLPIANRILGGFDDFWQGVRGGCDDGVEVSMSRLLIRSTGVVCLALGFCSIVRAIEPTGRSCAGTSYPRVKSGTPA